VTPRELLETNGDFTNSPLIATARRLHALFASAGVPYAIIGGLAVARSGGFRTTHDVDVLTRREGWETVRRLSRDSLETTADGATDPETSVHVDVLFAGDDWHMVFPMPDPADRAEMDTALGARFLDLRHLLELKCAVYLSKLRLDGPEIAAKDLADVVALLDAHRDHPRQADLASMHPAVARALRRIRRRLDRAAHRPRRPRSG